MTTTMQGSEMFAQMTGRAVEAFSVTRDNDRGSIFLKNGQMVHASVGDLIGEEAVYALSIWNHGDFLFSPGESEAY